MARRPTGGAVQVRVTPRTVQVQATHDPDALVVAGLTLLTLGLLLGAVQGRGN